MNALLTIHNAQYTLTHLLELAVAQLQVLVEPVDAHGHLAVGVRDLDVALLLQQAHLEWSGVEWCGGGIKC